MKKLLIFLLLFSSALPAVPFTYICTDKDVGYDTDVIYPLLKNNRLQNVWGLDIRLPLMDSKSLSFMLDLARQSDQEIFSFIDSLDKEAFKLITLYAYILEAWRLIDFIQFKMIKNPAFLSKERNTEINYFIHGKAWDLSCSPFKLLEEKYFDKKSVSKKFPIDFHIDSIHALLSLVHFYQETMKRPLSLDTDHLKKIYESLDEELQKVLIDKNLITLP